MSPCIDEQGEVIAHKKRGVSLVDIEKVHCEGRGECLCYRECPEHQGKDPASEGRYIAIARQGSFHFGHRAFYKTSSRRKDLLRAVWRCGCENVSVITE